ncbi:hypothetical protein ACF1BQ_041265 [Bradyrhizobium sp. RDT10]
MMIAVIVCLGTATNLVASSSVGFAFNAGRTELAKEGPSSAAAKLDV